MSTPAKTARAHPRDWAEGRKLLVEITTIGANAAVACGVLFAFYQLVQSAEHEKVRVAIEATTPTRSAEFLQALEQVIDAHADNQPLDRAGMANLIYVMNVYDNIAALYLRGAADRGIIEARVKRGVARLVPVHDASKWPAESRENFDRWREKMGK